jgi:hypothetical protein
MKKILKITAIITHYNSSTADRIGMLLSLNSSPEEAENTIG